MSFRKRTKNLVVFTFAFILFTVIGIVSHEYGHILAANYLGYETKLHYASMDWNGEEFKKQYEILYLENEEDIHNNQPFPDKQRMDDMLSKFKRHSFIITLAGPLQTTFTGILGLLLLFLRRNMRRRNGLKIIDWLGVFMALFWLREIFNLMMSILRKLITGKDSFFGGDEMQLSLILGLPAGTFSIALAILGLLISYFVIFRIIPKANRPIFVISGCIGGLAGYFIWMYGIGPVFLP